MSDQENRMRVGWIGLGAMGLGMARCAARAGHRVTGHTRGKPEHKALSADGGRLTSDLSAVIEGADAVCVNVFNDDQVRSVIYSDGVLSKLRPGCMLVLHTTSDPSLARQLARDAPKGVEVIDAAFSGSPDQAAKGVLTMMVGGSPDVVARAQPLLQTYAEFIRHVGSIGAGMYLKLINNLLFAAHVRLAADAFRIAESEGFKAEAVTDVLARSSGASRALDIIGSGGQVNRNLTGMRTYLEKDIKAALASARTAGADAGVLGEVAQLFCSL